MNLKEQILSKISIQEYIGRHVSLKPAGKYHKGLCPFHNEKTPSFTVDSDKQIFHCFGCGEGGDLFTFVQKIESTDFNGSIKILCDIAGIEYKSDKHDKSENKKPYLQINKQAARIFYDHLRSQNGALYKTYIEDRGLNNETLNHYGIGSAPDDWQFLSNKIDDKKKAEKIGLIASKSNRYYDFFRNRIMFPVRDIDGAVIGFSGRSIDSNEQRKYINSIDSSIFQKGNNLYGIYEAKEEIKKLNQAIIVEGNLDPIGLYQAGIKNAVAPMGTALTDKHLMTIRRYAENIIVMMDGDRAGRNSTIKAAKAFINHPGKSLVCLLPENLDPFDLSLQLSTNSLQLVLSSAISSNRFLLVETIIQPKILAPCEDSELERRIIEYHNTFNRDDLHKKLKTIDDKMQAVNRLLQLLNEIESEYIKDLYLHEGAKIINTPVESIKKELNKNKLKKLQKKVDIKKPDNNNIFQLERLIVSEIIKSVPISNKIKSKMDGFIFSDTISETMWRYIEYHNDLSDCHKVLPQEIISEFSNAIMDYESKNSKDEFAFMIDDFVLRNERLQRKEKLKIAKQKMIDYPVKYSSIDEYLNLIKNIK